MKYIEKAEMLRNVRFANKFYDPVNDVLRNEYINHSDLEVIRFDRKNWIEYMNEEGFVYFVTIEDYKNCNCSNPIVMKLADLQWLTNCGYGYLKG